MESAIRNWVGPVGCMQEQNINWVFDFINVYESYRIDELLTSRPHCKTSQLNQIDQELVNEIKVWLGKKRPNLNDEQLSYASEYVFNFMREVYFQ